MDIDVSIGKESLSINIENPQRFDLNHIMKSIIKFGNTLGVDLSTLKTERLISKMIRGVAGCEGGCPADARGIVREGFGDFKLFYVEGGILSAVHTLKNGESLSVKIFPDFA